MHALSNDLARVFQKDLDRILRLYAVDEVFAEICRDYVTLSRMKSDESPALPDVLSSLEGLEQEIRDRLSAEATSGTAGFGDQSSTRTTD